MIFGVLNPEKIWRHLLVHLSTSLVYCSHFTLGNQKFFSTVLFIHTLDYLRYLRRKQTVTPLPTTHKNVTAVPCKISRLFIFFIFTRIDSTRVPICGTDELRSRDARIPVFNIRILSVSGINYPYPILIRSIYTLTASQKNFPRHFRLYLQHWLSDFNTRSSFWHRCRCCLFSDVCHNH